MGNQQNICCTGNEGSQANTLIRLSAKKSFNATGHYARPPGNFRDVSFGGRPLT